MGNPIRKGNDLIIEDFFEGQLNTLMPTSQTIANMTWHSYPGFENLVVEFHFYMKPALRIREETVKKISLWYKGSTYDIEVIHTKDKKHCITVYSPYNTHPKYEVKDVLEEDTARWTLYEQLCGIIDKAKAYWKLLDNKEDDYGN